MGLRPNGDLDSTRLAPSTEVPPPSAVTGVPEVSAPKNLAIRINTEQPTVNANLASINILKSA